MTILSFGEDVEVISPQHLRNKLRNITELLYNQYEDK